MDLEIIILSQRKTISYITYMWNLKNDTNELIYKTETDYRYRKMYGYQRGKVGRRNKLGIWA